MTDDPKQSPDNEPAKKTEKDSPDKKALPPKKTGAKPPATTPLPKKHRARSPVKTPSQSESKFKERKLAPGEYLFKEGDSGDLAFFVKSGTVEICKLIDGDYKQLVLSEKGSLVGEMALIDHSLRSAAARAVGEVTVIELGERELMLYLTKDSKTSVNLIKRLISYVRQSNEALEKDVFSQLQEKKESVENLEKEPEPSNWKKIYNYFLSSKGDKQEIIDQFQPPIEMMEKQTISPLVRRTFFIITFTILIFILWASFSVIDTTVNARGKFVTSTSKIDVEVPEQSVVKSVHVQLGDRVKKGDVIAQLDPTYTTVDYQKLQIEIRKTNATVKRLQAEKNLRGEEARSEIPDPIQQDIYIHNIHQYSSKIRSLDLGLNKAIETLKQAENSLQTGEIDYKTAVHEFEKKERLFKDNILSEMALIQEQFKVEKAQVNLNTLVSKLENSQHDYDKLVSDKESFLSQHLSQINNKLAEVIKTQNIKKEEFIRMKRKQENVTITAPVDGIIIKTEGLYDGSIVSSGESVAVIVPVDVPLFVEMDILPRDIGNIMIGNKMSIKLDALNYQKHGDLEGELSFISEDTFEESINGEPGTFYRARAEIVKDNLVDVPEGFRLIPGMQVSSHIKVGKRVLITYFIYPIIRTINTSFREP